MEAIFGVLPFIVFLALLWLLYVNISFIVTIIRAKKADSTLRSCLSTMGKYFYLGLIIIYIIALAVSVYIMILATSNPTSDSLYLALNIITILSLLVSYLGQQIIYIGHRQILIGKVKFDYRKIKRVTFPKPTKLRFTYGQKELQTSLWFIDTFELKKALQKSR